MREQQQAVVKRYEDGSIELHIGGEKDFGWGPGWCAEVGIVATAQGIAGRLRDRAISNREVLVEDAWASGGLTTELRRASVDARPASLLSDEAKAEVRTALASGFGGPKTPQWAIHVCDRGRDVTVLTFATQTCTSTTFTEGSDRSAIIEHVVDNALALRKEARREGLDPAIAVEIEIGVSASTGMARELESRLFQRAVSSTITVRNSQVYAGSTPMQREERPMTDAERERRGLREWTPRGAIHLLTEPRADVFATHIEGWTGDGQRRAERSIANPAAVEAIVAAIVEVHRELGVAQYTRDWPVVWLRKPRTDDNALATALVRQGFDVQEQTFSPPVFEEWMAGFAHELDEYAEGARALSAYHRDWHRLYVALEGYARNARAICGEFTALKGWRPGQVGERLSEAAVRAVKDVRFNEPGKTPTPISDGAMGKARLMWSRGKIHHGLTGKL